MGDFFMWGIIDNLIRMFFLTFCLLLHHSEFAFKHASFAGLPYIEEEKFSSKSTHRSLSYVDGSSKYTYIMEV